MQSDRKGSYYSCIMYAVSQMEFLSFIKSKGWERKWLSAFSMLIFSDKLFDSASSNVPVGIDLCIEKRKVKSKWRFVEMYGNLTSVFVCSHRGFGIPNCNFKFISSWPNILEVASLVMDYINSTTLKELHESLFFCWIKFVLSVCEVKNFLELTRKLLQKSHLVLSHFMLPGSNWLVVMYFLLFEGAWISLRFLDLLYIYISYTDTRVLLE